MSVNPANDTANYIGGGGATREAVGVVILGGVGGAPVQIGSKQETLTLINNNVASQPQTAFGGDYIWSVVGTFGGASVQLQALGPDGATYQNIGAAKTSADTAGGTGVGLGTNAVVRAAITGGTPTGLFATLSRIP